jgi:hypothetical protein
MKKFNRAGKTFTTVVAGALVLGVFGTGTAVAGGLITSAKIKNNTVKSIDVKNNNLKGVDVLDGGLTGADVANGSLTGADVADGSLSNQDVNVLFASVNSDGTVAASSGGVTVSKPATGRYGVRFPQNIKNCAVTATPANTAGPFVPIGVIGIGDELNHPEGAYVWTKDTAEVDDDMGFHLVVVC